MRTELDKRFSQLQKQAGMDNVWPVVDCRWGYAAFIAYVVNIKCRDIITHKPYTQWWVVEMTEDQHVSAIKPLCNYD